MMLRVLYYITCAVLRYVTLRVPLYYVTVHYAMLCYVTLRYVTKCYASLRHVTQCYVMLRYAMLCVTLV